jgi:hypothetical protein
LPSDSALSGVDRSNFAVSQGFDIPHGRLITQSDEPSPGTMSFFPRRIRATAVYDLVQMLMASVLCVSP